MDRSLFYAIILGTFKHCIESDSDFDCLKLISDGSDGSDTRLNRIQIIRFGVGPTKIISSSIQVKFVSDGSDTKCNISQIESDPILVFILYSSDTKCNISWFESDPIRVWSDHSEIVRHLK